ncbi:Uncharacterized protein FKW44_008537, partial [Caligus rogercresseyi]
MDVKSCFDYSLSMDQVFGPNKRIQVAMIRGLFDSWKMPVYYAFDTSMSVDVLFKIINEIERRGITVVAVVSDMAPSNVGLRNSLGVTKDSPYFWNPYDTSKKIYMFHDVPHLIKLLRNHLLDRGYYLPDGSTITKKDFQNLMEKDSKSSHKIKEIHLECQSSQRQRVCLATQLLSHTTASALKYIFPNKTSQSDFIDTVDSWFDTFNSRRRFDSSIYSSGFGTNFQEQNEVLQKMKKNMESIRGIGKQSILPFQYGILLSISSLENLFHDLATTYG